VKKPALDLASLLFSRPPDLLYQSLTVTCTCEPISLFVLMDQVASSEEGKDGLINYDTENLIMFICNLNN
jgi:hypothetical protein